MIHRPLCMRCSFVAVVQRCIIPYTALCHGWRLRALASVAIVSAVSQCKSPTNSRSLGYPVACLPNTRQPWQAVGPYVVHSIFRTMRLQCSVNVHIAPSYVWRDCAVGENVYCRPTMRHILCGVSDRAIGRAICPTDVRMTNQPVKQSHVYLKQQQDPSNMKTL